MTQFTLRPPRGRAAAFVLSSALPLMVVALVATARVARAQEGPDWLAAAQPQARVIVAPALHTAAESFEPATVCATFSVPLARSWHVGQVNGRPTLGLNGASTWSFRALDTWPDGAVKWALCECLVTAGGSQPLDLYVTLGDGSSGQAPLATDQSGQITVDTGPLRVSIAKQPFQLFNSVIADGKTLLASPGSGGIIAKALTGEVLAVRSNPQVGFECNGPARSVVRVDGTLERSNHVAVVDFTCRLAFVRGSRDVEVTFTVRNANINQPRHVQLESLDLIVDASLGGSQVASFALPGSSIAVPLQNDEWALSYQARSDAPTQMTVGSTPNYLPHLPKLDNSTYVQEGYSVQKGNQVLYAGDKTQWPTSAWADLSGSQGGITLAFRQMAYQWPATLQCGGQGVVGIGLFPAQDPLPYTWVWRQHESRTAVFSFHGGPAVAPEQVARRLETPVVGRMANYQIYDWARVLQPYDLVSVDEQEAVYALLGTPHAVSAPNTDLLVTRFLPASTGGGPNNHDWVTRALAGEYLRFGVGGSWMNAMDLALYKSEWQILRSDNFLAPDDPGASNDELPHSKAFASDDEHRYREGMCLAYWLSGDERIKEALYDEAEILPTVDLWPQERGMYQTLRAMAAVATFAHAEAQLDPVLRNRIEYITQPQLDVDTAPSGWGWDGPPGLGQRGYFVYSQQHVSEKAPGETFVSRGFVSGSMGPIAYFTAAQHLGENDPQGSLASLRLKDLATYTRDELFPDFVDPLDRHLVYSYGVKQKLVTEWEQWDFHPIQLGMAEAWRQTGDASYLKKGVEQVQSFAAHGNLSELDHRVEFQHFCRAVLQFLAQPGG